MLLFLLFMLGALFVATCVAVALVSTGLAIFSMMLVAGIVSSAVIFGFLRKSATAAFQTLVIQVGVVAGSLAGLGATTIATIFHLAAWESSWRWLLGPTVGAVFGLTIAWLFNKASALIAKAVLKKLEGPGTT